MLDMLVLFNKKSFNNNVLNKLNCHYLKLTIELESMSQNNFLDS